MSKKVFYVSIHKEGKAPMEVRPGRHLTIGESYDCDIVGALPGVKARRFRLVQRSGSGHYLRIPEGLKGTVNCAGKVLSIEGLVELGLLKKRRGAYILRLPRDKQCTVTAGDMTITMGYREEARPQAVAVRIDGSLKRAWISREDYSFLTLLVIFALVHFATVNILHTIEISKPEPITAIKKMPPRFARLILQPPEERPVRRTVSRPFTGEVDKGGADGPAGRKKAGKGKPAKAVKKQKSTAVAKKAVPVKKSLKQRVRSKGLLGVITAKSRLAVVPADIFEKADTAIKDISRTRRVGKDEVDSIVSSVSSRFAKAEVSSDDVALAVPEVKGKDTGKLLTEKKRVKLLNDDGGSGGKGKGTGKARISKAELRLRDEAEVYKKVRAYIGGLKYIYNNALRHDQTLKGKVTVRFVITPEGRVRDVVLVSASLKSSEVVDKILKKIYRWKFSRLKSGEDFSITYTFDFSPVG